MDYYEDWDDERPLRRWRLPAAAVVLAVIAGVGFWRVNSDNDQPRAAAPSTSSTSATSSTSSTSVTTSGGGSPTTSDRATPSNTESGEESATSTGAQDTVPDDPTAPIGAPTTSDAVPTPPSNTSTTDTTAATGITGPGSASTSTAAAVMSLPPQATDVAPYPTSPDGLPLPIVVIFDTSTITISGEVPSQAAKERLASLAVANSQFPDAQVVNNLVVNPAVPISVGVRVIELNSARFPEGTAQIQPDHAKELDRVVAIMNALPNITVLVIGHADQRGDDQKNFAISDERARAVVNYLRYLGISPTRLSSRAAGSSDLLTNENDDASFALNRRTEFLFYGLLVE